METETGFKLDHITCKKADSHKRMVSYKNDILRWNNWKSFLIRIRQSSEKKMWCHDTEMVSDPRAFCNELRRRNPRWPVDAHPKGCIRRSFDASLLSVWTKSWINNDLPIIWYALLLMSRNYDDNIDPFVFTDTCVKYSSHKFQVHWVWYWLHVIAQLYLLYSNYVNYIIDLSLIELKLIYLPYSS